MGFPWRGLAKVGLAIGGMFIPGLEAAVTGVEEAWPQTKGPEKKAAVLQIVRSLLPVAEQLSDRDLDDPKLVKLTSDTVDAYVTFKNAEAQYLALVQEYRATVNAIKASKPPTT